MITCLLVLHMLLNGWLLSSRRADLKVVKSNDQVSESGRKGLVAGDVDKRLETEFRDHFSKVIKRPNGSPQGGKGDG